MTEDDLLKISTEIYVYAALVLKFFGQALEDRLHAYGVAMSGLQYNVLMMFQYEKLTISTISQRLSLDPSTMVRIVDALERKGLALRGADPHDRRRNPIQITQKGLDLIAAIPAIAPEDLTVQALQSLGIEPTRQLRDLLLKIVQQFPEGKMVSGAMSGQPPVGSAPNDASKTDAGLPPAG